MTATSGSIKGTESVMIAGGASVAKAAAAAASTVTGNSVAHLGPGGVRGRRVLSEIHLGGHHAPHGRRRPDLRHQRHQRRQKHRGHVHVGRRYGFTVTITDPGNRTVTSSVTVTVSQTLTKMSVSPANVSVSIGATQQFTAGGTDQFGEAMTTMPAVTWTTTKGLISSSGVLTAPAATGTLTVMAACGGFKSRPA